MRRETKQRNRCALFRLVLVPALLGLLLALLPAPLPAQMAGEELVANLATGRLWICVASDGIAIGAVENRVEEGSRLPLVVELSRHRAAVLLGAVEWLQPGSGAPPMRMDRELVRVAGRFAGEKRLQQEHAGDIEAVGLGMLEVLRKMTERLHHKLDWGPEEPLLELLLVGYVEDYGPEVWSLQYRIEQEPLRGNYWHTRLLRPRYVQLYPPEKGQPHTLIEAGYPGENNSPGLLEQWNQEPKLAPLRASDPQLARATEWLAKGQSQKATLNDALAWMRAALNAFAPPSSAQFFAVIAQEKGFNWILAPPEAPAKAEETAPREPGAPTLRKKP